MAMTMHCRFQYTPNHFLEISCPRLPNRFLKTVFAKCQLTRRQSNMAHLIGTQTKLKEMQITILKLALMAQKKHEMEVSSSVATAASWPLCRHHQHGNKSSSTSTQHGPRSPRDR
jgi:hypothetical protein